MATIFNKNNIIRRFKRWNKSCKVYSRNWMGVSGLIVLLTLVILAIFAKQITGAVRKMIWGKFWKN